MRSLIQIICLCLAVSGRMAIAAPVTNPTLTARDSGIDDENAKPVSLDIADLDVIVDIVGNVARTTVAARFTNPGDDDLEGTFSLQMPEGAVVTGYALDVEETMIDGVLAPPIRARRVYEQKVRQGIDPGVAEVARGNVFSTRVYPVLAGKGRTIRLSFAAPVHAEIGFTLPLANVGKPSRVALSVRVRGAESEPRMTWPEGVAPEWTRKGADLVSEVVLRNRSMSGELHVEPLRGNGRVFLTRHPSGKRFVELRDAASAMVPVAAPRSVRVYWDRSLSRADDALAAELSLLEKYLATLPDAKLEVVTFNSTGANARAVPDGAAAVRALRGVRYRGATSFASFAHDRAAAADVCLLFSDGVSTIDSRPEARLGCTLFAIASARDADRGYLELLARLNGGAVLTVARDNVNEILAMLKSPAPRIVDVRSSDGRALRFAPLPGTARGWALVAEAPPSGDIVVRIAGIAERVAERRYTLGADSGWFAGAGALWAFDRVSQIIGDGRREQELRALSLKYSVASPAMSFIVLEAPEDYVLAKIEPPASYPKEGRQEYRRLKREFDTEEAQTHAGWLDDLVEEWQDQKEWWASEFDPQTRAKKVAPAPQRALASPQVAADPASQVDEIVVADVVRDRSRAEVLQRQDGYQSEDISEVSVTGFRASSGGPRIAIEVDTPDLERPYLKALENAGAADYERVLAAQSRKFGSLPVFFFDVAQWLHREGRHAEAVEMLLSALELPARDTETLSVVADRLMRYQRADRAVWLYEEVLRLDPDRPQPARTLALALEKRASMPGARSPRKDLGRALELLAGVIMTPHEDEYEGIALVCLMDANGIIPRLRKLGVNRFPLDDRLVALLDVDLRVVIEWNTGATDMDLWVDQPDGERSIYSNPRTAIGGRLSIDMTQGYGPEEYLLRRAIAGQYAISVNVYDTDAINPNGATMVTAHLTRNFGREDQSTETLDLELRPDETGEKLLGRFNVGPRSAQR